MKSVISFIKHTIAGGIFFLIPIFVMIIILQKFWGKVSGIGLKVAHLIGINEGVLGINGAVLVSIVMLMLMLFICGLLYRISVVGNMRSWIDAQLLKYIPGYDLYKANIEKKIKHEEVVSDRPVVLIHINGVAEPAVLADTLADGRKVVFVADKPGSADGQTYIVSADKTEPLTINEATLKKLLAQQGKGWHRAFQPIHPIAN